MEACFDACGTAKAVYKVYPSGERILVTDTVAIQAADAKLAKENAAQDALVMLGETGILALTTLAEAKGILANLFLSLRVSK